MTTPAGIVPEHAGSGTEDITRSPLWNPDLAPTPPERRTWSTYNIAALWIGMSVVITTYTLASGLMQQGMSWWQAMVTILLGNTVVLVPMVLNAHAGTKSWIGGLALDALFRAAWPGWASVPGSTAITFMVFWLIQVAVILKGTEGIKLLESWSAPLLLAGGAILLLWAIRAGGGLGLPRSESLPLRRCGGSFVAEYPSRRSASRM